MTEAVLFIDAILCDPLAGTPQPDDARGWLLVEDGLIAATGTGEAPHQPDVCVIDARGRLLSPGFIDVEVLAEAGDGLGGIAALSERGARAGVTHIVTGLTPSLQAHTTAGIARAASAPQPGARVSVAAALFAPDGCTVAPVNALKAAGAGVIVAQTAEATRPRDLARALVHARTAGLPVFVRALEASLAAGGMAHDGAVAGRLGLPGVPTLAEVVALSQHEAIARAAGLAVVHTGLTCGAAFDALGAREEAAVCVRAANLAFNALDVGAGDARFRLDPVLREEADREDLSALIASAHRPIAVTSGHQHVPLGDKQAPFALAPEGGAGLEALVPLALSLHGETQGALRETASRALGAFTSTPAAMLNAKTGTLRPGTPADLTLLDRDAAWKHTPDAARGASAWDGRLMTGRADMTLVAGRVVYDRHNEVSP